MCRTLVAMLFVLSIAGLSCEKRSASGPCAGVDCSGHGTCDDSSGRAVCVCDEGYHPNGLLECIADTDPCEGVTCDEWETCVNGACDPLPGKCNTKEDCGPNEECENHACVWHDPCEGVDCSGHGECKSGYGYGDEVFCDCDDGYHAVGLSCVADGTPDDDSLVPDDDTVTDPCAGVTCDEWKECQSGDCVLKPGRCDKTTDCAAQQICDTANHTCIADPCLTVQCGNGGICSVGGITPLCNCPDGFMVEGLSCVADTGTPVNWCNLQWPPAIEATVGDAPTRTYSQLYIPGITDGGKPQNSSVIAQLGYTTKTLTYPVIQTDFVWADADFNITGAGSYGNNHEYMADFPTTKTGVFKYLYRYSLNGGKGWYYCDLNGKVTSAAINPGIATISGNGENCGGTACAEWETCAVDTCDPLPGRCNTKSDCAENEECDLITHHCVNAAGVLILDGMPTITTDSFSFTVRYIGTDDLDLSKSVVTLNGADITATLTYDTSENTISISKSGITQKGKYSYLFRCRNTKNERLNTLYVPLWVETTPFDWRDAFLYQIMNDRFLNGDLSNDNPVAGVEPIRNWMGGDYAGIIAKLDEGYFDALGVNALWISSPVKNTESSGLGMNDNYFYSAYHSYWPIATGWTHENPLPGLSSPLEDHFGTEAELRELVRKAHAKGIRILVDFVGNHVHLDSPLWALHKNDGWFNMAPAGKPVNQTGGYNCGWDAPIECWFTDYLPDFDYRNEELLDLVLDHAVWLVQEYDFDGFRMDAVKHMVMAFTTGMRARIQQDVVTTGIPFYMVGETFDGDKNKIAEYVGADKLDGQFDFPLYFQVRDILLQHSRALNELADFVAANDPYYTDRWSGAIMSNFLGNHDVQRALTFAGGNTADAYKRLRMAQTFLMTSPGIPLIYQGDDIGMEGGGDPDNRRMMIFGSALSAEQQATIAHLRKLGTVRENHPALRTGTRTTLIKEGEVWAYRMKKGTDEVLVILNRSNQTIQRQLATSLTGALTDAISGATATVSGGTVTVSVPAMTSAVYTK